MRGGPEGRRSRAALEDLIGGRPVDCDGLNFDRYGGRVVAICKVDGKDIGEEMLAIGQGRHLSQVSGRQSSRTAYIEVERHARDAKRGLWNEDQ